MKDPSKGTKMADKRAKSKRTGITALNEHGKLTYEYSDGAWRYENGSLASPHPKAMALWDSDEATTQINGRHQRVLEAREQAYIKAARELDGNVASLHGAAAVVTDAQFQLATSPDMGHASTQAAKDLDKTLDLVEERAKETANTLTLTLTDSTAARVLERLARK